MDIPRSVDDLSSEWLTSALRRGNVIGSVSVNGVEWASEGLENGLYGQLYRLALTYDQSGPVGPSSLIAKLSTTNPDMRHRPNTKASYTHEVRFYQEMANECTLETPLCYYADVDRSSGWHVLLLEDLSPALCFSLDEGCSIPQALNAIRQIAVFHAYWWQRPMLDNVEWLVNTLPDPDNAEIEQAHERWWPSFCDVARGQLPRDVLEAGKMLGKQRGKIIRHLFFREPKTLLHGDYSIGNLMFAGQVSDQFSVIDWQFLKRGRGMWDVACFLATSVTSENRRFMEMDAIDEYVSILNSSGVHDYSLDDATYDYRVCLLQRLGTLISTIAALPMTNKQKSGQITSIMPRVVDAVHHNNCRALFDGGL